MELIWYIVNVEGVVVRSEDGRYLMVVRGEQENHAPGALAFPGGKVENAGVMGNVLKETLRREIEEEVRVQVHDDMVYLESNSFIADDGDAVVDVVFLCHYKSGEPTIGDPDEVAGVRWMTAEKILDRPETPPWTRRSIELAEKKRIAKGW
ncbi:MAG: NUDIX hydrolase [Anaerolineae bacterium]